MSEESVSAAIHSDEWLSVRWSMSARRLDPALTEEDPFNKERLPFVNDPREAIAQEQDRLAIRSLDNADDALKKKQWKSLGLKDHQVEMLSKFQAFVHREVGSTLDTCHGGLVYLFTNAASQVDAIAKQLDDFREKHPNMSEAASIKYMEQYQQLMDMFVQAGQLMDKVMLNANRTAKLRLEMALKQNELENKQDDKKSKPGFRPLKPVQQTDE